MGYCALVCSSIYWCCGCTQTWKMLQCLCSSNMFLCLYTRLYTSGEVAYSKVFLQCVQWGSLRQQFLLKPAFLSAEHLFFSAVSCISQLLLSDLCTAADITRLPVEQITIRLHLKIRPPGVIPGRTKYFSFYSICLCYDPLYKATRDCSNKCYSSTINPMRINLCHDTLWIVL